MVFHRNKNKAPTPEQIAESAHLVIETVKETGLDPEHTLIMGGSALALAGIRPAGDIDLIIPEQVYHRTVGREFALPSGIALRRKSNTLYPVMETYGKKPGDRLHVDVTTAKRDYGDDQRFLEELETYESIQGFKYLPPLLVAQRKLRSEHRRRKDDKDIDLIHQHIERSKIK